MLLQLTTHSSFLVLVQGSDDQTCIADKSKAQLPPINLGLAAEPSESPKLTDYEKSIELVEQMAEGRGEALTSPGQRSLTIWHDHATDVTANGKSC